MRRQNPISVRVRAPSRGLVTRLPGESADLLRPGDLKRTSTNAQNVRYEDGVIKNCPGFSGVQIGSLFPGLLAHWKMDEAVGSRLDSSVNSYDLTPVDGLNINSGAIPLVQVDGKIGKAVQALSTNPHPVSTVAFPFLHTEAQPLVQLANGSFTISGWFKIASSSLTSTVFSFP